MPSMDRTVLETLHDGSSMPTGPAESRNLRPCRMSDLAVPMLMTFEDDAVAFWCFERLMQKVKRNFRHDESGIK